MCYYRGFFCRKLSMKLASGSRSICHLENNILRHCIITFPNAQHFKLLCYYRWFFAAFNVNLQIVEEVGNRRIKNSSFPTFPSLFCATKIEFFIQTKFENKILKVNNFGMKALLALWDCSIVILWQQFVVWCTDAFSLFMEDWFSRTNKRQPEAFSCHSFNY